MVIGTRDSSMMAKNMAKVSMTGRTGITMMETGKMILLMGRVRA